MKLAVRKLLMILLLSAVFVLPAYGNAGFQSVIYALGIIAIIVIAGVVLLEAGALKAGSNLSWGKAIGISFCVNFVTAMLGMVGWEQDLTPSLISGPQATFYFIYTAAGGFAYGR